MENNIPKIMIDKSGHLQQIWNISFFEEKINLPQKIERILKRLGFNTSKKYIIKYEPDWPTSHKQMYIWDNEHKNKWRLTFDIILGDRIINIEEYHNESNEAIPITKEKKYSYENYNNKDSLKEDLDAIKDETEAIQNEIKRRENCKRRELKR